MRSRERVEDGGHRDLVVGADVELQGRSRPDPDRRATGWPSRAQKDRLPVKELLLGRVKAGDQHDQRRRRPGDRGPAQVGHHVSRRPAEPRSARRVGSSSAWAAYRARDRGLGVARGCARGRAPRRTWRSGSSPRPAGTPRRRCARAVRAAPRRRARRWTSAVAVQASSHCVPVLDALVVRTKSL